MKAIFSSLLFILILFSISQFIFNPTNLYNEYHWLDIPMHILGGVSFAMLFVSVLNYKNKNIIFFEMALFVFIVGLLWEIYEYSMYVYFAKEWGGVLDTIKDLFDDLLGAGLVFCFNKKNLTNNE